MTMIGKNLSPESMSALQNAVTASAGEKPVFSRDVIILAIREHYGWMQEACEHCADHIIKALAEQNLHIVKTGHSDKGV